MEHLLSLKDPSVTNEQMFVLNRIPGHFNLVLIMLSWYNAEFASRLMLKDEGLKTV